MQSRTMQRGRGSTLTRGSSISTVSSLSPNERVRRVSRLSSGTLGTPLGARATSTGAGGGGQRGVGAGGSGHAWAGASGRGGLSAPLRSFLVAEFARVQQSGAGGSSRDATLTGLSAGGSYVAGHGGFKPDMDVGGIHTAIVHEAEDEGGDGTTTPTPRGASTPIGSDSGGDDVTVGPAAAPAGDGGSARVEGGSPGPTADTDAGAGEQGHADGASANGASGAADAAADGSSAAAPVPRPHVATGSGGDAAPHESPPCAIGSTPRLSLSPVTPTPTPTGSAASAGVGDAHRDYLRCEEVCKLAPPQDMPVRFSHVAVLYAIDANHDGRFSMRELEAFLEVCVDIRTRCKPHEFETLLQGRCVTLLLQQTRTEAGVVQVVDWLMRMLEDSYPPVQAGRRGATCACVAIDAVFVAYNVLCGGTLSSLDFTPSQLLDLLHLAAEEQGLLDLDDGDLDDLVPVQVLRSFVHHFVRSVAEVYRPMGLAMPGLTRGTSIHARGGRE